MLKKFNLKYGIKEPETPKVKLPQFEVGEQVYYRPYEQRNENQIHLGKIARIRVDALGFKFYEIVATPPKHPNKKYIHSLPAQNIFKIEEIEGKNGETKV